MELKLVRGIAADLAPVDKHGRVTCRVGEQAVQLHRDLSTGAKAGDEVLVGGELHTDVVHCFALKNFTNRRQLYKVDFTFHVLGGGFGIVLAFFGFILMDRPASGTSVFGAFFSSQLLEFTLILLGLGIAFLSLHRVPRINKLTRWVDSVRE